MVKKFTFLATNVIKTHLMLNQHENIAFFLEKKINVSRLVVFTDGEKNVTWTHAYRKEQVKKRSIYCKTTTYSAKC